MPQKLLLRCGVPLLVLALFLLMAVLYVTDFHNYFRFSATLFGYIPGRQPFFDWEFISAGIKCWNEGVNVYLANPCDAAGRPHDYSPLWLRATFIPTDRAWTAPIGIAIVLAFLASLFWVVRPTNWRELIALALACLSPMVLYGLERGNADVIIFIMLVVAGVAITGPLANRLLAYGLILLAGLLKFYPLVGFWAALRERPRIFVAIAAAAVGIVAVFVYRFKTELAAAARTIPDVGWSALNLPFDGPKMAAMLFPALGRAAGSAVLPYALIAILIALTAVQVSRLVRDHDLASAFARVTDRDAMFLVISAAVIAGCFFVGHSKAYRGINLILVVAGLLAMRRAAEHPATRAMLTQTVVIVIFLMWHRFFRVLLANPDDIPTGGPSLKAFAVLGLAGEVFWWRLTAVLLAILAIFTARSELLMTLQQWSRRHRRGQSRPAISVGSLRPTVPPPQTGLDKD